MFLSLAQGRPLTGDDAIVDFGGCFEGVSSRRELFLTNDSEFDLAVRMTSDRTEEVFFVGKGAMLGRSSFWPTNRGFPRNSTRANQR